MADWAARHVLRLVAICTAFAGAAALVAAMSLGPMVSEGGLMETVWSAAVRVGAVLLAAGGVALYLVRARSVPLLDRSVVDGRRVLLALALVALPLWVIGQLAPLAALWRDIALILDETGVWQSLQTNAAYSGLMLAPILAALVVPFVQASAAAGFALSALMLLVLMMSKSSWLLRAFLICIVLQSALVYASVSGVGVTQLVIPRIERAIDEVPPRHRSESERALEEMRRYAAVTRGASRTLVFAWVGWAGLLVTALVTHRADPAPLSAPARRPL